ncbi:MAG: hypothetical protein IJW16_02015 [Clostridia bacterium]|nr:hypothetical protein [Clostridia bacterium]
MDFINEDILSGEIVPVLLGYSPETVATARRLYERYRVVSHVFCDHVPLPLRISLCMKFHVFSHASGDRLMLEVLDDFVMKLDKADVLLYLIPCTESYANLVWHNRDALERRFVLPDRGEMDRVWFGSSDRKEERK